MVKNNSSILEKANAAVSSGDNEGFLSFCTDDTLWTFVGDVTLHGKQEVRQWMLKNYIEPPDFKVDNLIEGGDYVTALGTINLKNADGRMVNHAYCDVWRFRDGKMAELKAYVVPIK